jgi:O-antigen/teichoic acid export membrane protein
MAKESQNARVARHGIIYVGGQMVGSLASFLTIIILTRQLDPASYGFYAIAISFYTILGIFATFSMGTAMRKKLAEDRGREGKVRLISSAYSIGLSFSLLIALIGIVASGFIAGTIYHQPQMAGALALASLLAVFWALFNITIAILVGIGRVKESAIVDVVYSVIQLVGAPLLVALGFGLIGAITGLGLGLILGTVAGLIYIFKDLKIERQAVDPDTMKEIVSFSFPVFVSTLALQGAYTLGVLVLGTFVNAGTVGDYFNAYKLGSIFVIIISSLTFVLLPAFSAASGKSAWKKKLGPMFNRALYFSALILAPIVAVVAALSRPIIYIFFGQVYALPYLAIMSFGIVLGVMWNYSNTLFIGIGDTRSVIKYQLLAAGIQILLLVILTPLFGIVGMLAGLFVLSPIAINLIYAKVIRDKLGISVKAGRVYRVVLASLVLFLGLYALSALMHFRLLSIPVDAVVAVLVYPPLVAKIGGLGKKELTALREIFGARRIAVPFMRFLDYAALFA